MRNTVFIQLDNQPGNSQSDNPTVTWVAATADGNLDNTVHEESLSTLAAKIANRPVIVFTPGTDTSITHTNIPTRNRQRILKAIPYALEDQVLGDVEQMHFALGKRNHQGDVPVIITSREKMEAWLSLLSSHGIHPHAMIPAPLCLPLQTGHWTAVLGESLCHVRTGENSGFSTEPNNFITLCLMALDNEKTKPDGVTLLQQADTLDSTTLLTELEIRDLPVEDQKLERNLLLLLAETQMKTPAINLLQGEYAQSDSIEKRWRPWFPAAAMLAALLCLQVVSSVIDLYQLSRKNSALQQQIAQLFQETLPDTRLVKNKEKVIMEHHLASLQGGQLDDNEGFLSLLQKTGALFSNTPGLMLSGLRYQNGQLDVELTIDKLQALEQMKARIEQAGLHSEIRSATKKGNQVTSHLRISRRITGAAS